MSTDAYVTRGWSKITSRMCGRNKLAAALLGHLVWWHQRKLSEAQQRTPGATPSVDELSHHHTEAELMEYFDESSRRAMSSAVTLLQQLGLIDVTPWCDPFGRVRSKYFFVHMDVYDQMYKTAENDIKNAKNQCNACDTTVSHLIHRNENQCHNCDTVNVTPVTLNDESVSQTLHYPAKSMSQALHYTIREENDKKEEPLPETGASARDGVSQKGDPQVVKSAKTQDSQGKRLEPEADPDPETESDAPCKKPGWELFDGTHGTPEPQLRSVYDAFRHHKHPFGQVANSIGWAVRRGGYGAVLAAAQAAGVRYDGASQQYVPDSRFWFIAPENLSTEDPAPWGPEPADVPDVTDAPTRHRAHYGDPEKVARKLELEPDNVLVQADCVGGCGTKIEVHKYDWDQENRMCPSCYAKHAAAEREKRRQEARRMYSDVDVTKIPRPLREKLSRLRRRGTGIVLLHGRDERQLTNIARWMAGDAHVDGKTVQILTAAQFTSAVERNNTRYEFEGEVTPLGRAVMSQVLVLDGIGDGEFTHKQLHELNRILAQRATKRVTIVTTRHTPDQLRTLANFPEKQAVMTEIVATIQQYGTPVYLEVKEELFEKSSSLKSSSKTFIDAPTAQMGAHVGAPNVSGPGTVSLAREGSGEASSLSRKRIAI